MQREHVYNLGDLISKLGDLIRSGAVPLLDSALYPNQALRFPRLV
jgi:hypothetical protein